MRAANHYIQTAPVNSLGEVKVGEEKGIVPFLIHIKFLRDFFIIIIMLILTKRLERLPIREHRFFEKVNLQIVS